MACPKAARPVACNGMDYSRDLRRAKWGSGVKLHGSNLEPPMSALGQKQTFGLFIAMSALPPKADIGSRDPDVRYVPKADNVQRNKKQAIRPPRRQMQEALSEY